MSLDDDVEKMLFPSESKPVNKITAGTVSTAGTFSPPVAYGVPSNELASDYTGYTTKYPAEDDRPCYCVYEKRVKNGEKSLKTGVYYHFRKVTRGGASNIDLWICAPLYVEAVTHDKYGNNFGRYLKFKPTRGAMRKWSMPMTMLKGAGDELRGELLNMGLNIDIREKAALGQYISGMIPSETLEISTQTGWHKGAFVLPGTCIGSDSYFFQSEFFNTDIPYRQQGTLQEWQTEIASYCVNNPLLMLAVCSSFAGALLRSTHQQGGGFHIFGDSSKGKSTGLFVACSVWGDESYKRSWKATSNGMEATAVMFNDSLLALDEISECDPRDIGAIVYSLGNGTGKQRANKNGGSKATHQWKIIVLSNGERSVESAMSEAGKQAKAGQALRLLNIPLFGKYGAFDFLHGMKGGRQLSDHLQTVSTKFYGVAGIEYLQKLVSETRNLDELFAEYTEALVNGEALSSQEMRAAKRFALVALAGELATEYGVTSWDKGRALSDIYICFQQWRNYFGEGDIEDQQILQAVRDFIDRFSDSRFSQPKDDSTRVIDRAGYWIGGSNGKTYLFNKSGINEALKSNGFDRGVKTLKKHGWLIHAAGRNTKQHRINGRKENYYCVCIPEENDEDNESNLEVA